MVQFGNALVVGGVVDIEVTELFNDFRAFATKIDKVEESLNLVFGEAEFFKICFGLFGGDFFGVIDDVENFCRLLGEGESFKQAREDFAVADSGEDGSIELESIKYVE